MQCVDIVTVSIFCLCIFAFCILFPLNAWILEIFYYLCSRIKFRIVGVNGTEEVCYTKPIRNFFYIHLIENK